MAKNSKLKKQTKSPQKIEVYGVNDPLTRKGWIFLAFLCVFGGVSAVKAMKLEGLFGYKYLGMVVVTLYVIQVFHTIFSEAPSPVYRAHRWVRTIVPLILYIIIYFTIYNFQTYAVAVLVISLVFGLFVLVQLVFPVEGFYFLYVLGMMVWGGLLAIFAHDFDPKIHPFWFCFLTLFVFEMLIYFVNYPAPNNRAFSFY